MTSAELTRGERHLLAAALVNLAFPRRKPMLAAVRKIAGKLGVSEEFEFTLGQCVYAAMERERRGKEDK